MTNFKLNIVTPDGEFYNGEAQKVIVRTIVGDVCILAKHTEYMSALGLGIAKITIDGKQNTAACINGMITVSNGNVRIVATTFEWSKDIDKARAEKAKAKAEKALADKNLDSMMQDFYELKLKRALVRLGASDN